MVYFLVFVGLLAALIIVAGVASTVIEAVFHCEEETAQGVTRTLLFIGFALYLASQLTACKPKPAPSTVPVNTVDTTRQRLERNAQRAKKTKDSLRSISKTAQPYASATADYDSVREHLR